MRKLEKLKTLNIRNMPTTTLEITRLPLDLHKAWATAFVENLSQVFKGQGRPTLKTIALGSLTWSDVWLGQQYYRNSYFRQGEEAHEFLQLRVYQISYVYDPQGFCSPVLDMVAKGCPRDLEESSDSLTILKPYWLG